MMLVGPYQQNRNQQAPPNIKCYRCEGNHLITDCPEPPPVRRLPPVVDRFCEGCCWDHLPKDCSVQNVHTSTPGSNTVLNYIGVVPSPHLAKAKADRRSLNTITRSQNQKNVAKASNAHESKTDQKVKKKWGR